MIDIRCVDETSFGEKVNKKKKIIFIHPNNMETRIKEEKKRGWRRESGSWNCGSAKSGEWIKWMVAGGIKLDVVGGENHLERWWWWIPLIPRSLLLLLKLLFLQPWW